MYKQASYKYKFINRAVEINAKHACITIAIFPYIDVGFYWPHTYKCKCEHASAKTYNAH